MLNNDSEKEPVPPVNHIKTAGHHWLDQIDFDGRFHQRVVLQWNPVAKRWSHSGQVGTGLYIDTKRWKYIEPCVMPE